METQYRKDARVAIIALPPLFADGTSLARGAAELEELRQEIAWDRDIRCLVVSGRNVFAAPDAAQRSYVQLYNSDLPEPLTPAAVLARFDIPTIAVIEADARGPGLELALACDLRVCSPASRFSMDHLKTDDLPMDGGIQRLGRLVGRGAALGLVLIPEQLDAEAARAMGLVTRIAERPMELALTLANGIGEMAPVAVRYSKEALQKGMDMSLEQGLRLEADLYFLLQCTDDRTRGISAFQGKTRPQYEGR